MQILLIAVMLILCTSLATVAQSQSNEKIFSSAKNSLGKQMWRGYGLPDGTLGCAASISNVLKDSGLTNAHLASVATLRTQLLRSRVKPTEIVLRNGEGTSIDNKKLATLVRPGDIVLAFKRSPDRDNSGPNAHCGIMASGQDIMTNDWNDGIWKQLNIHVMFDYYPYVRVIRMPKT